MLVLSHWLIGLIVLGGGPRADEPAPKLPKEIKQAEETLTKWVDGFKDKTAGEVKKVLGAPTKESTWLLDENKELLLYYKLGASTELSLYFFKDKVVKASLHILP